MSETQSTIALEEASALKPKGMGVFMTIWLGQLISLLGSGLTGFALGVWIFESTGRATPFVLTALFSSLPNLLLSPVAGVVADRWNRRWIMIISDTAAALMTLFIMVMVFSGRLQIWHIYLTAFIGSAFGAFQNPAYTASVTMLVPKEQLGRASGLLQSGQAIRTLLSPVLAGFLFVTIGLKNIILIDFVTFFFAVGTLMIVVIPQPEYLATETQKKESIWKQSLFGLTYIKNRVGLLSMLLYFALVNFLLSATNVLLTPLVLTFTDARTLGFIQAVLGAGMLLGSIAMSAWGGPKRKMMGVYGFIAMMGVGMVIISLSPSPWMVGAGLFVALAGVPIAAGCSQVIWQTKVEPGIQGRVFAIRGMIATAITPLAFVTAGLVPDKILEPLMRQGGGLGDTVGQVIGTGPGREFALMYLVSGLLMLVVTAVAYLFPRMRLVEDELPDMLPDEVPRSQVV